MTTTTDEFRGDDVREWESLLAEASGLLAAAIRAYARGDIINGLWLARAANAATMSACGAAAAVMDCDDHSYEVA